MEHPMSDSKPLMLLILYLNPSREGGAFYCLDEEILSPAGIGYTVIDRQVNLVPIEGYAPFSVTHKELRLVLALDKPISSKVIDELAGLVGSATIFGFTVKGEIDLSSNGEVYVINNLN
jgi:hypothetical protein